MTRAQRLVAVVGLGTLLPYGCVSRATLPETLHLLRAGRTGAVLAECEAEETRWREANPDTAAAVPAAIALVERAVADDALLLDESPHGGLEAGGRPGLARELRESGLSAGGGPGRALRALAADLLSDAPLRILRAAQQAAELRSRRLAPHLVANIYSDRLLEGAAGPLDGVSLGVRMLTVKRWCLRALRRVLLVDP